MTDVAAPSSALDSVTLNIEWTDGVKKGSMSGLSPEGFLNWVRDKNRRDIDYRVNVSLMYKEVRLAFVSFGQLHYNKISRWLRPYR